MARHKPPQDIRHRRGQGRTKLRPKSSKSKRRWWRIPIETLGVLSAIAGVLTLLPRLSLDISGTLQPHSPTRTIFSIGNNGLLPVHDVTVTCGPLNLLLEGGGGISGISFRFPDSYTDLLSPGQQMATPCDRMVDTADVTVKTAKMAIHVTYRPDFVWWHRHIEFSLEAQKRNDGTWLWRRLPK